MEKYNFLRYEEELGESKLLSLCENYPNIFGNKKIICIFDRDTKLHKKVIEKDVNFKKWSNGVYSFAIPVPAHRESTPDISIEHYYTDEGIKTTDEAGRRLYLGNEFCGNFGLDMKKTMICKEKNKCGEGSIKIIDNAVYSMEETSTNIALSKNDFATKLHEENHHFKAVDCSNFNLIVDIIDDILED